VRKRDWTPPSRTTTWYDGQKGALNRLAIIFCRRPFIFQGVRGVCTTSVLDYEEADKQALVQALGENEETFNRTKELGEDPSEGFTWLLRMGLDLDRELEKAPKRIRVAKEIGPVDTVRELITACFLRVRDKRGKLRPLYLNRGQKQYSDHCGKRNIVLKARQLGITTCVAARFFVHTITHPGTLSVQVAHDQQSAEEIFRIVHRFVENLPAPLRKGALRTSRANVRQIVFPCIEGLFGPKTGADKKNAALAFVQSAITVTDALANKQIIDQAKFSEGLGKVVDGVVGCLNASVWAKKAN
jgi:hypothetical protein